MGTTPGNHNRPLLLATAGHVNHGKSTLLYRLTGVDPDRLPQEKARGMTLDLGFVHGAAVSYVDCPGHERLVRHTAAGHGGMDGALFVVALNEGIQEQTREHARLLQWCGVTRVLIVITKMDTENAADIAAAKAQKLFEETRLLFGPTVTVDKYFFSRHDDVSGIEKKILSFFSASRSCGEHLYNRFFIDRAFTLNGVGTVVTGTLTEGALERGGKTKLWIPGRQKLLDINIRAIKQNRENLTTAAMPARLALNIDGARPAEIPRGAALLWGEDAGGLGKNLALELNWIIPVKKEMTALLQVGTVSIEARLRLHPSGMWRARSAFEVPWRRGDRVIVRVPHRIKDIGHVVAGGKVLDIGIPDGRVTGVPPENPAEFVKWAAVNKSKLSVMQRMGATKDTFEKLLPRAETPRKPAAENSRAEDKHDDELLRKLFELKWQGFVGKEKLHAAHALSKAGLAWHVKDEHFLHHERREELLKWLNGHFEKNAELTVDHARDFFGIGRKTFLTILEFCDRHAWTFRAGNSRKKFKLPSCSRPSVFPPSDERERETRSARLDGSCSLPS